MRGKQNELLLNMLLLFPTQHLHNSAISAIKKKKKKTKTNTPTHTNRTTAATFAIAARHQPTTTTTTNQPTTTNQQQLLLLLQICNQLCNQQHNNNNNKNNNHHPKQQQQIQQRRNQIKPHLIPKMQNKKQKQKKQPTNVFPGLSRILARRLQTGRVRVPVRASAGECREARRWFDNGLHGRRKGQMRT